MKVYCVINGVMHSGEAPDGAMSLQVGGTNYNGIDLKPILSIDYKNKTYKRIGDREESPWPELVYRHSDVTWTPE